MSISVIVLWFLLLVAVFIYARYLDAKDSAEMRVVAQINWGAQKYIIKCPGRISDDVRENLRKSMADFMETSGGAIVLEEGLEIEWIRPPTNYRQ